jgi:spectinomycin phosphotransferase
MLEKPHIEDDKIIARVREGYGLHVSGLEFLPIGYDANSWVYRVHTAEGSDYFLKLKKGAVYEPSVAIPHYLNDAGIEQVVAPLATAAHELWTRVDAYALFLYPYIDGVTGMQAGMSERQWIEFGTILKRIHTTPLSPALLVMVQRETFVPKSSGLVWQLQALVEGSTVRRGTAEAELAGLWKQRQAEITRLTDRADELGRLMRKRLVEFVLCHTDIHTANVLIDGAGGLHIVDWDAPLLSPVERDLMFVTEAGAGEAVRASKGEEAWFFDGYGKTDIDPLAMAFYRYDWAVQEIGAAGEWVFLTPEFGEVTKRDAVRSFRILFQPGDVVEGAYRADPGG